MTISFKITRKKVPRELKNDLFKVLTKCDLLSDNHVKIGEFLLSAEFSGTDMKKNHKNNV